MEHFTSQQVEIQAVPMQIDVRRVPATPPAPTIAMSIRSPVGIFVAMLDDVGAKGLAAALTKAATGLDIATPFMPPNGWQPTPKEG
jgi:hypothetical protein